MHAWRLLWHLLEQTLSNVAKGMESVLLVVVGSGFTKTSSLLSSPGTLEGTCLTAADRGSPTT
jgi:hypothetical protein